MEGYHTLNEIETMGTLFMASGWYLVMVGVIGAIFNIKALMMAMKVRAINIMYFIMNQTMIYHLR